MPLSVSQTSQQVREVKILERHFTQLSMDLLELRGKVRAAEWPLYSNVVDAKLDSFSHVEPEQKKHLETP